MRVNGVTVIDLDACNREVVLFEGNLKPFIGAMVVCVVTFIVANLLQYGPVSDEGKGANIVLGVLYDFQTLAGGALAVCAAWWTIKTMEKTDRAAAQRHMEEMDLVSNADKRMVERAINPQISSLTSTLMQFEMLRNIMLQQNSLANQFDKLVRMAGFAHMIFSSIQEVLEREQLKEGSRLFEGVLTYKLNRLHARASSAVTTLALIEIQQTLGAKLRIAQTMRGDLSNVYSDITVFVEEIPIVTRMMLEVGEKYGVN